MAVRITNILSYMACNTSTGKSLFGPSTSPQMGDAPMRLLGNGDQGKESGCQIYRELEAACGAF